MTFGLLVAAVVAAAAFAIPPPASAKCIPSSIASSGAVVANPTYEHQGIAIIRSNPRATDEFIAGTIIGNGHPVAMISHGDSIRTTSAGTCSARTAQEVGAASDKVEA